MIVYRCCQCTHDHETLTPPQGGMGDPKCARCGGSTFAQINLPDTIDADFDEGPPLTPRDAGPGDEPRSVAQLRPVEDKRADQCQQSGCEELASHRFTWPGHPESRACYPHAQKATRLAEAMGFFLEAPALETASPVVE